MAGQAGRWLAGLVAATGLAWPGVALAGHPPKECCPPGSYTPWHYWTPMLYRVHYCLSHGPRIGLFPPQRYPEIAPRFEVKAFPCPPGIATYYVNGQTPLPERPPEKKGEEGASPKDPADAKDAGKSAAVPELLPAPAVVPEKE